MDYERIHKVQSGALSPSKLRLKILGAQQRRMERENGSSRSSPTKLDDSEFAKNQLLAVENAEIGDQGPSKDFEGGSALDTALDSQESDSVPPTEAAMVQLSSEGLPDSGNHFCSHLKRSRSELQAGRIRFRNSPKNVAHQVQSHSNLSMAHPVKSPEEDNPDYDSNASSSSFEFHRGERTTVLGPFSRPAPSKWNDAEKWIMNKHNPNPNPNLAKKTGFQTHISRQSGVYSTRIVPESMVSNNTKRSEHCHSIPEVGLEKFSFVPCGSQPNSGSWNGNNSLIDRYPVGDDQNKTDCRELCAKKSLPGTEEPISNQAVISVSMRDMGTEMTPVTSQEPSRTGTPIGATTPIWSPSSSLPSTPRRNAPGPTPAEATDDELDRRRENNKNEMCERELQLKTRREIATLGVQLGKMNIAAWASKEEDQHPSVSVKNADVEQLKKVEFETRAAAWEEAERSKHTARYKREEIKIQAWEGRRRSKLEAEMRRIEIKVEKMKTREQERLMNKLATSRRQAEQRRAAAEAKRDQKATKTARQSEYIHRNGRIPSSFLCCTWLT